MTPDDQEVLNKVRHPVVPILQYPDGTYHNDSTPLIFDLERRHFERSIVPKEPGQAFLAMLLEDMADELGTKVMFFYRWFRPRDQFQLSEWISFDRLSGWGRSAISSDANQFRVRQVERMAMVGSTAENAPLIEAVARRVFEAFERQVTDVPYLFGTRPSLADFSWFGQLSQLATDPTPGELMRSICPYTVRWLANIDDASGIEGTWRDPSLEATPAVNDLLALAGDVYLPYLTANAHAIERGEKTIELTLTGRPFRQAAFKYHARCLEALRTAFATLDRAARQRVVPLLEASGCMSHLS